MRASKGAGTAIATAYGGINFRSRLEATWAAFFDLCKWEWEYEPFDLPGYIPDFLLRGAQPFIVDVRPAVTKSEYLERANEVRTACPEHEILVVGTGLFLSKSSQRMALGVMSELVFDGDSFDNALLMSCAKCGAKSFYHESMCWRSRICGHYDGDHYLGDFDEAPRFWADAKNATQWRAVTPRV